MKFKDFCETYTYIDGCAIQQSNCMSIYYNIQLVFSEYRLSFMIQPIDYKYSNDYAKIILHMLNYYDRIDTKCHPQGTLIFLKKNLYLINSILDSSDDANNHNTLGKVLSYPCYKHSWSNTFISLYVKDRFGLHQLLANWYNDDDTIFLYIVEEWKEYLIDHFHCDVYTVKKSVY